MESTSYRDIRDLLRQLYVDDPQPWFCGFSGGKDSTMVASFVFDAILPVSTGQRKKPNVILCTDTRVEIPAVAEGVKSTLESTRRYAQQHNLNSPEPVHRTTQRSEVLAGTNVLGVMPTR